MAETTFTIGNKIRIVNDRCAFGMAEEMRRYLGKEATIKGIIGGIYKLDIDNGEWNWSAEQFELVSDGSYTHAFTPPVFELGRLRIGDIDDLMQSLGFEWGHIGEENSATEQTMTKLTDAQQRNLSDDAKALVQAGYYDADLTLADEDHFMNFLLNKFESEYAAQAKAELQAEADKTKALADGTK